MNNSALIFSKNVTTFNLIMQLLKTLRFFYCSLKGRGNQEKNRLSIQIFQNKINHVL